MPLDTQRTDTVVQLEALANMPLPVVQFVPAVAAATAYEIPVYKAPSKGLATLVTRLSIIAAVAIPAVATNFQTLQFRLWRAGVVQAAITGAVTYATTTALAVQTELLLFNATGATVALAMQPGDILTLQNVSSGTGAALPAITAVIEASPVPPAMGY